jgi:hypothetical protein
MKKIVWALIVIALSTASCAVYAPYPYGYHYSPGTYYYPYYPHYYYYHYYPYYPYYRHWDRR